MSEFVHLGVHTHLSVYDSLIDIKELISASEMMGFSSVSVNDDSNLFGAIKLYTKAQSSGLKPIISAQIHVQFEDIIGVVTLIVQDQTGYLNLCKLISIGYDQRREKDEDLPVISLPLLLEHSEGNILLTGGMRGLLNVGMNQVDKSNVLSLMDRLRESFPDRLYIELQRLGLPNEDQYVYRMVETASRLGLPVVATNEVRFLRPEDYPVHEVRVADIKKISVNELRTLHPHDYTEHQYLKSSSEMYELFSDIPSAITNTTKIAQRCSIGLTLDVPCLPHFKNDQGITENEDLVAQANKGLQNLITRWADEKKNNPESISVYQERLNTELKIINDMGFPGYFLIVSDIVQWSKDNLIPVGPGRGSGAGSLVAYALKITDLDPLDYDLLFERFLNPERVSMPDFDIDFCMELRDQVIKFVSDKYGEGSVSQIVTFGTMGAKAAVKGAARALAVPYMISNKITKMIPNDPGMTLDKAIIPGAELDLYIESDVDAKRIINFAKGIEGKTRSLGKHAGGVVISPSPLYDYTPTYRTADFHSYVTMFDKNDVETAGLVKFDFLGLRTLTIVNHAVSSVNAGIKAGTLPPLPYESFNGLLNIEDIPIDDKSTYELYQSGETTAVFQVESSGMKQLLRRLKPDCFEDIIALVALFRPGPLQSGMVDNFIDRKHGREAISYPDINCQHECLKEILEPTYGIILYQEQVMKIAQVMAGYTLGQADMLRRAMGKKKPEEMAKQRDIFKQGAVDNGIDGDLALKIFSLVEKFAGYGFNKSHSAAYALVSYQTAWLKKHYPAQFMASVMSAVCDDTPKVVKYISECRNMNLSVLPPDINESQASFTSQTKEEINFGLGAVKGIALPVLNAIKFGREISKFKDVYDFCRKVKLDKSKLIKLCKSGAFERLHSNRASLIETIPDAVLMGKQHREQDELRIKDLFEETGDMPKNNFVSIPEAPIRTLVTWEIETLGLCLSSHPMNEFEVEVAPLVTNKIGSVLNDFQAIDNDTESDSEEHKVWKDVFIKSVGAIMSIDIKAGAKGNRAIITFDDNTHQLEMNIFNKTYSEYAELINSLSIGDCLYVEGKITYDRRSETHKMIGFKLMDMQEVRDKYAEFIYINLDGDIVTDDQLTALDQIVSDSPEGPVNVIGRYLDDDGITQEYTFNDKSVRLSDTLIKDLTMQVPQDWINVQFKSFDGEKVKTGIVLTEEQKLKLRTEGQATKVDRHNQIRLQLSLARASLCM
ncbi:DNA polymerase III subunit alpha [Vibrio splendidus]